MTEFDDKAPLIDVDDVMLGVEMGLLTQEQVVADFRDLVERDVNEAAGRYHEFAAGLEAVSSGGNTQVRSLMGGPDSSCRAGLVDIMAGKYATASVEVKEMIVDEAARPLLRDNFFYVRLAVAQMKNPYLVGDIIREFPLANPGANYYGEDLVTAGAVHDQARLQAWLDKFGGNIFAASTVALQKGEDEENVRSVIVWNEQLFRDAAHVTAATHDLHSEIKLLKGSAQTKTELTQRYRSSFVDLFAEMVKQEADEANWTPLRRVPVEYRSSS